MIIMRKYLLLYLLFIISISCTEAEYEKISATYPDGSAKTKLYYKDAEMTQLLREVHFYDNEIMKMEGFWEDGEKTGHWKYWFQNGTLWTEAHYESGKENGLKTVYYKNGQKYYEGKMVDGERNGMWKFWDMEGNELKTIDYPN